MPASPDRTQTAFRFTPKGRKLLERLAKKWGVSMAAVLERLIREEAERQSIR
jgi:DNA-binding MarR family transcriptional regulator